MGGVSVNEAYQHAGSAGSSPAICPQGKLKTQNINRAQAPSADASVPLACGRAARAPRKCLIQQPVVIYFFKMKRIDMKKIECIINTSKSLPQRIISKEYNEFLFFDSNITK